MRRIGSTPQERGSTTGATCPDVIEMDNGDFFVIGKIAYLKKSEWDRLKELGASIGSDELAVIVPRNVVVDAARELLRREDIN